MTEKASPLRYPGGKSAMTDLLRQIRYINTLNNTDIAEPFAGGAGASLNLLYSEETRDIYINDADPAIYDFWWSLIYDNNRFLENLRYIKIDINEWIHQQINYRNKSSKSQLHRGFATFYLNRCNRSGIINGGPIGGKHQSGKWKLDARFNKIELERRCKKVETYRDRIHITKKDGIKFIESVNKSNMMFFIDPPYYEKGGLLYMNLLTKEYHSRLANYLRSISNIPWILTYDDCPEIRSLYSGWSKIKSFSLRYSAAIRRKGKELLIVPNWMRLPINQSSNAISW